MHFCGKCDNMYYLRLSEANSNKLIHYCRNCGNEETITNNESICISNNDLIKNDQKYKYIINKYTKLDPTLPRTNTIKCPNQSCPSNKEDGTREIIYVRYDDDNVKYIYICSSCNFSWKIDEQQ
jgi:DNA-directed RNA polymerase subunit M/transcription elongation factor TFIIS